MAENRAALETVDALIEHLRQRRGADLSFCDRSALTRQIASRQRTVRVASVEEYLEYLDRQPEEASRLLDGLIAKTSEFFLDRQLCDVLDGEIIPAIVAGKSDDEPIRIWSAGCASGEEVFTLAIVLAESIGWEPFCRRVTIYATDTSDETLAKPRKGTYDVKRLEPLGVALRARYLERTGPCYRFRREIRRAIVFGRHDLPRDPPISRLDLIVCRNVLVYVDQHTRGRVLDRFHYGLNSRGFLILGAVDMPPGSQLFEPANADARIFRKKTVPHQAQAVVPDVIHARGARDGSVQLRQEAFGSLPLAQIVVDAAGTLALANRLARTMFDLDEKDRGRPFRDLELSFRPIELRSLIDQVRLEGTGVIRRGIKRVLPLGDIQYLDVQVRPLHDPRNVYLGAVISFHDTTEARRAQLQLRQASEELLQAHEDLQSTNEDLQSTNEELRATVEELEATNEELHAINEEHEALNDELQTTSDSLRSMNVQLQDRTEELKGAKRLLEAILGNIGSGVVVVDQKLAILIWSKKMEDLSGLRSDEVRGRSFAELDSALPVADLLEPLRDCLAAGSGSRELVVTTADQPGQARSYRVSMNSMTADGQVYAAVMRIDHEPNQVRS